MASMHGRRAPARNGVLVVVKKEGRVKGRCVQRRKTGGVENENIKRARVKARAENGQGDEMTDAVRSEEEVVIEDRKEANGEETAEMADMGAHGVAHVANESVDGLNASPNGGDNGVRARNGSESDGRWTATTTDSNNGVIGGGDGRDNETNDNEDASSRHAREVDARVTDDDAVSASESVGTTTPAASNETEEATAASDVNLLSTEHETVRGGDNASPEILTAAVVTEDAFAAESSSSSPSLSSSAEMDAVEAPSATTASATADSSKPRSFSQWISTPFRALGRRRALLRLRNEVDKDTTNAAKESEYSRLLSDVDPGAAVSRFENGGRPVSTNLVVSYVRALVRSGQIDGYYHTKEKPAVKDVRVLTQTLGSVVEKASGGELAFTERTLVPGSSAAAPLYFTESSRTPLIMRPIRLVWRTVGWIASSICFLLLVAYLTFASDKLIVIPRSATFSSPSSSGPSSQGAPELGELGKEVETAEKSKVRFKDVLGCDEAKEEMMDVVEFLRHPEKFQRLGGKLPKGVLLEGPPGTGKTLLARAVAGEADVPFFYKSGSEFEEMFVGVGAKRIRNLFMTAKRRAPCLVFIDEIDAIGTSRKLWEGHTKKTLNQLLSEMDGFEQNEGVIVIAATNLAQALDPALTRSGRFDRHVTVSVPDLKGRKQLLTHYLEDKPVNADVDVPAIARGTTGMSGAELANVVNEAALEAAKRDAETITASLMEFAKDKVLMGAERKSLVLSEKCKTNTAYHESGHAIVAMNTAGATPVHKATIMPRGRALGMVMRLETEDAGAQHDEHDRSKQQLLAELDVCMGGRVAEEIIFGKEFVTTGAQGDFQQATKLARRMVMRWGMSDKIGHVYIGDSDSDASMEVMSRVDGEVSRLLEDAYARVLKLLKEKEQDMHTLAKALLEWETLSGKQIKAILSGEDVNGVLEGGGDSGGAGGSGGGISEGSDETEKASAAEDSDEAQSPTPSAGEALTTPLAPTHP